jgi:hypothetical protein
MIGKVFRPQDAPTLPMHPHCWCFYLWTDEPESDWGLGGDLDPQARRAWIRYIAWMLRTGIKLKKWMRPLRKEAEAYNDEHYPGWRLKKEPPKGLDPIPVPVPSPVTEELPMSDNRIQLQTGQLTPSQREGPPRYDVTLIAAGENANGWILPPDVLAHSLPKFDGTACMLDHCGIFEHPSVQNFAGTYAHPHLSDDGQRAQATLRIADTTAGRTLTAIADAWLADQEEGLPVAPIGLSADMIVRWDDEEPDTVADILRVLSVDLVLHPAAGGRVERILNSIQEDITMAQPANAPSTEAPPAPSAVPPQQQPEGEREQLHTQQPEAHPVAEETARTDITPVVERINAMTDQINDLTEALAALAEPETIQGMGEPPRDSLVSQTTGERHIQTAWDWVFGVDDAQLPPPSMRRTDELYRLLTGDYEWTGQFDDSRVHLATANASTLANMVTDAMNKVIVLTYDTIPTYRWYEQIVTVSATDGTLHDMKWLDHGGIGDLPKVPYGSEYTELTVDDAKEADSFNVYGGYVGITRKVLRNSEIGKIQAIPRMLTISAIRTRSAKISSIFTTSSGLGPTLDNDSTALFDATHNNYATTAFSYSAWASARQELFEQTELNSSKALGLWPRFWIGPVELYDEALKTFGYGQGPGGEPGTADNDVNVYAMNRPGDPRPVPIACPDFTDANNWYYLADPKIQPVIFMAYANSPGGNRHPAPELFTVTNRLAGMQFMNDVLPIKIRDEYSCGVATFRGIGGRVVT